MGIKVIQCRENKPSFCSVKCSNFYYKTRRKKRGRILKCKVCGQGFYRNVFALKRKDRKPQFCSMRCRAMWGIKHHRKSNTDIERILEEWLVRNKIIFEKQTIIEDICIPDFFIKPNICLFADGDYWHSLPKRKESDARQVKSLRQKGYCVVRILGSRLLNGEYPNEILQYYK